jgi:hypothetical protein
MMGRWFLCFVVIFWVPAYAWPTTKRYSNSSSVELPLRFNANGTFQISIFEDLHFGENAWDSWGPQQDINSVKVINSVLDRESPDLVVLNGDLITGDNAFLENATIYIEQIVGPLLERNLPWASAYGNHDHQYNLSADALLAHEQRFPNSLTQKMVQDPQAGTSNYYLPVYDDNCTVTSTCTPLLLLWFFDSRGGARFQTTNSSGAQIGLENWVDVSVVNWFQQTNAALVNAYQKTIPSLAFVHIPPYASLAFQRTGVHPHPHYEPGINDDVPLAPQAQGWCADGVTNDGSCEYGGQDGPFMAALAGVPGLVAVFSGHDHGDTWCWRWDSLLPNMTVAGPARGVNLCFGQHSGYGGYGNWERGARQVRVQREQMVKGVLEAESWVRLEGGRVVGRVGLNATYGEDWYEATNRSLTVCPSCNYSRVG